MATRSLLLPQVHTLQAVDLLTVGALAAEVMAEAIVRAARMATGIPGYPAARDLAR